jgi:Predicted nucleic-acid-binding protein containing a Zn-ribbon
MASVAREWREIPGRYNLKGSKCGCCGKIFFPKRSICPKCRRASMGKMEEYKLSKEGKIFSYSVIHEAPAENSTLKPYAVAIVETKDGVKVTSQLVDVDLNNIEIGMEVRAVFRKISEDSAAGIIHYGFKFAPKN